MHLHLLATHTHYGVDRRSSLEVDVKTSLDVVLRSSADVIIPLSKLYKSEHLLFGRQVFHLLLSQCT